MKFSILAATAALVFSGSVMANTCANPIAISSNSVNPGNTCDGENALPTYGGISSPQKEIIYRFVANAADADLNVALSGLPGGAVFLIPAPCAPSTDPIKFGFEGTDLSIDPGSLTDGSEYFLIVTADPGGADDACGGYTLTVDGTLPVELQNFSVD